jgi:alpha,alpha-trehalose phosphorylase
MAGTWMGVVYGFAGMRVYEGSIQFAPYLPEGWSYYQFTLQMHGRLLQVHIDRAKAEYRLLAGEPLSVAHYGRAIQLTPEAPAQAIPA